MAVWGSKNCMPDPKKISCFHEKVFFQLIHSVLGINLDFFWIEHKILDFFRPSDSHLGQNWSFPFQIPTQRTNAPSLLDQAKHFDRECSTVVTVQCACVLCTSLSRPLHSAQRGLRDQSSILKINFWYSLAPINISKIFDNNSFWIRKRQIFFPNLNYNCSNLLDMGNLQELIQKSILLTKIVQTFHFLNKLF